MRKFVGTVAVVLLALCAVWYFLSPGYAMMQLRDAAVAGDKTELEARIDFPRVREGLKADLRARMAAEVAEGGDRGIAALGGMLAMGIVDGLIDGFVTPESMSAMIEVGKLRPKAEGDAPRTQVEWDLYRESIGRFSATPVLPEDEAAPALVFELDGLGWKLVKIDLPEQELEATP